MQVTETLFPELQAPYRTRVYFGLGVDRDRLKIGITGRENGRRGGEMHFEELCCVPGDKLIEQRYHRRYAEERIGKTEWFYLSDRLLMDLIIMCVQQGRRRSTEILTGMMLDRLRQAVA